jgi:hypothetical protein
MSNPGEVHFNLRARSLSVALAPWLWLCAPGARADGLIEGIDDWSRAMVLPANAVWRGPRVEPPVPTARPVLSQRLDASLLPLSVHAGPEVAPSVLRAVLGAGEAAFARWAAEGLFEPRGDGGAGGTSGYDLYLMPTSRDIDSGVDVSSPVRDLDAVRAFALLDTRVGPARLAACTAEALADALLRELDPAERDQPRRASAVFFAQLATGAEGCGAPEPLPSSSVFGDDVQRPELAPWLAALDARHAHGGGRFVADAWQLARQRTWEGEGLRASPSLIEAVAAMLAREDEPIVRALGELAGEAGRALLVTGEGPRALTRLELARLPARVVSAPLAPLATRYVLVRVDDPQPGERISVWLRGEYGVRWALSALRLDAQLAPLGHLDAKVRDAPSGELHVELMPGTAYVLVSATNGSGRRVAYFEAADDPLVRAVELTLDRRVGF